MYIDPGFGSLLFQALAALVIACGAYFTATSQWLKKLFGKKVRSAAPEHSPDKQTEVDQDGFLK